MYIHKYTRTYIHTYIHAFIHTYIHTFIRTYVHVRTCINACIYTVIPPRSQLSLFHLFSQSIYLPINNICVFPPHFLSFHGKMVNILPAFVSLCSRFFSSFKLSHSLSLRRRLSPGFGRVDRPVDHVEDEEEKRKYSSGHPVDILGRVAPSHREPAVEPFLF